MLLLNALSEAAGLAVLADHVSPTTFHYLPGSPRVVRREGRPGVQLLRYRAPRPGGLLLLEVDLAHDPVTLEAGRMELLRRHGAAELVPVTFQQGVVRLVALGVDSTAVTAAAEAPEPQSFLVERVMGSSTPALFGAGRAIFSVELSAEGATLVHRALQDASLPLAIVYELTFEGLQRARGARASIEFAMAYDFLRTRLKSDSLIFKADVDAEVEALSRAGLVSITDVDYAGTDPATLAARAVELRAELATMVESAFFRPSVSPATLAGPAVAAGTAVGDAWARGNHGSAAFVLRELSQRETGTLTYDLTVSRIGRRTIAPQGALTAMSGSDIAILDVDAEPSGVRSLIVVVPPGADWSGVDAIEVAFQQDAAPVGTIVVSADRTEGTVSASGGTLSYRTRVLARPEPEALGQPFSEESPSRPLIADHLVIDPAVLAGRRVVSIALDQADPHNTARGVLELEGHSRPFALDAARPSVAIPVWGAQPLTCAFAIELDRALVNSERLVVLPSERLVVLAPPPGHHQFVAVELADPTNRLETVFVEMEDGAGHRTLVRVDTATPRADWTGVRTAGTPAPFRWNARAVTKAGRSVETGWRDGAGSLLVVGDNDVLVRTVQVLVIGAPPTSIGAELVITASEPPPEIDGRINVVLESPFITSVRLPFRHDSARSTYRIEGRLFLEDGEVPLAPVESSDEVCLLSIV